MGIYEEYCSEETETPTGSEETDSETDERQAKRKRRRNERHRIEGKDEVCGLYMQGKCPKVTSNQLS